MGMGALIESSGLEWEPHSGQVCLTFRIIQERKQDWRLIVGGHRSYQLKVSLAEGSINPKARFDYAI